MDATHAKEELELVNKDYENWRIARDQMQRAKDEIERVTGRVGASLMNSFFTIPPSLELDDERESTQFTVGIPDLLFIVNDLLKAIDEQYEHVKEQKQQLQILCKEEVTNELAKVWSGKRGSRRQNYGFGSPKPNEVLYPHTNLPRLNADEAYEKAGEKIVDGKSVPIFRIIKAVSLVKKTEETGLQLFRRPRQERTVESD